MDTEESESEEGGGDEDEEGNEKTGEESEESNRGEAEDDEEEGSDYEEEKASDSEGTEVVSEEHTKVVGVEMNMTKKKWINLKKERSTTFWCWMMKLLMMRGRRHGGRGCRREWRKFLLPKRTGEKRGKPPRLMRRMGKKSPLIRKPRSARVAVVEETPTEEARGEEPVHTKTERDMDAEDRAAAERWAREERKRKGKQLAHPKKKKARQATRNVVIQDPIQVSYKSAEEEESDEEVEREAEEAAGRRREDLAYYERLFVIVDKHLLERMGKFKDLRQQAECRRMVSEGKKVKSGKKVHLPSLQDLRAEDKFISYIHGIGFEWLLEHNMTEVPVELAKEFFTSF